MTPQILVFTCVVITSIHHFLFWPRNFWSSEIHHPNHDETPPFQQPSRDNSISHHGRSLVGFAAVKDKGVRLSYTSSAYCGPIICLQALYVAPRPRPQHAQKVSISTPPYATTTPVQQPRSCFLSPSTNIHGGLVSG